MHDSPPEHSPQVSSRRWMGLLTLIILLAIVIGFWRYSENLIESLEHQAASLREKNEILATIAGPQTRLMALRAPADGGDAHGKLFFDSESGDAVLFVRGLPPSAGTERYCLWLVVGTQTTRVAEFAFPDTGPAGGEWYFGTLSPAEWRRGTWHLTREPRGNQPRPSGPIVLFGETD